MRGNAILFLAIVLSIGACSRELPNNDKVQKQINTEAFQNRFKRDKVADEKTGIKVDKADPTQSFANPNWKMVLMTGDDSISAFDNARKKVYSLFTQMGIDDAIQLSRSPMQAVGGVRMTSAQNFSTAVQDLHIQDGDGCLVFMTSHGSPQGWYIKGQMPFTPTQMNQILQSTCGSRPTVLLISACYSGIFAEPFMEAPNRIILTAARKDKTSFGCSAEAQYTYWDACLVDNLPQSTTWLELSGKIEKCIQQKEGSGGFAQSYPQARFGANVKNLPIHQ